jgi:hypothetical protein
VEYLEEGRGVILGYLIDGRSDVLELTEKHPNEAKEFNRLRHKASALISFDTPPGIQRQLSLDCDKAVDDLERHLTYIRTHLPGFDRFLLSPSSSDLRKCAADSPIVIVNVTYISSDVLIVLPSGVKHVPLPNFPASDLGKYLPWGLTRNSSRYIEKEGEVRNSQDAEFQQSLSHLWSDCVHLVLDELGFIQPACNTELP